MPPESTAVAGCTLGNFFGRWKHTIQGVWWLGQEDSNLRMTESKSVAVTNLAMPQYILRIIYQEIVDFYNIDNYIILF